MGDLHPQEEAELLAQEVNARLHRSLGVDDPCETACTHILDRWAPQWTVLGLANVLGRAIETAADNAQSETP